MREQRGIPKEPLSKNSDETRGKKLMFPYQCGTEPPHLRVKRSDIRGKTRAKKKDQKVTGGKP